MAVWLELRCENRSKAPAPTMKARCYSHDNNGPMQMSSDDQRSVVSCTRDLFAEAKRTGWKRKRDGWWCPCCAKADANG